jgi:hypothetical protein
LVTSSLLLFATGHVASGIWRLLGVLLVFAVLTTLLAPLARKLTNSREPGQPADASAESAPSHRERAAGPPTRSLMLKGQTAS